MSSLYFGQIPPPITGFLFSGIACGIKETGKKDLALMLSEAENTAVAGVFTQNAFAAGPVLLDRQNLKTTRGRGRAILANSGNANAGIGEKSLTDAKAMQSALARHAGIPSPQVFVGSTGKIGIPLPMDKVISGIASAYQDLSLDGFQAAAEAILTTDKGIKVGYLTGRFRGTPYTLAAMAKGAGMIAPNMATMLSYAFTDLAIDARALQSALGSAVAQSFNRTSVDGDMSTNDTVLLFANGRAGNRPLAKKDAAHFEAELTTLFSYLARAIVLDGEGATACMEITVKGAKSIAQAKHIASAIGNSPLVKCAIFGRDPNWGRILSAAGAADFSIRPEKVSLTIAKTTVFKNGAPSAHSESALAETLKRSTVIPIVLRLGRGSAEACYLASDLSLDYVTLNSAYRT